MEQCNVHFPTLLEVSEEMGHETPHYRRFGVGRWNSQPAFMPPRFAHSAGTEPEA
ncbi:MAG: hypothetical protein ABH878_08895 [bacterium]